MRRFLFIFFIILALPLGAQAATTTPWWMNDGANDSGTERQQRVRGYRQQSSELQQKISALGSVVVTEVPMPILFGVKLTDIWPNFGDPRDGGARTHEGEDILAVKGTPIVSPTPAVVLRTVTGSSEGNTVYTANPGGETFVYMHLDHFGEGVTSGAVLAQGALIGYVGDTGNAAGGPAHLHFEIHASSDGGRGAALDPFPRLKREFTLAEKMSYLTAILAVNADPAALATFLVSNFRSTFLDALAQNVTVPQPIVLAVGSMPAPTPRTAPTPSDPLDLTLGSTGTAVTALQDYLVAYAAGPAAARLAGSARGYFGPMTESALIEYQKAVGITPATGYYGPKTRAYIAAHPSTPGSTPTPTPGTPSGPGTTFSRDLELGMEGEDVRALQKRLNDIGFTVAASGAGSIGKESTYFGTATRAALIKYQSAQGITPAAGYFGPKTRAALGL